MSALAPVMEGFFTERLLAQRRASAHTVASYRDAFRLLLGFVQRRTGKAPSYCPPLGTKTVTPHVLRHTCAMRPASTSTAGSSNPAGTSSSPTPTATAGPQSGSGPRGDDRGGPGQRQPRRDDRRA
jgi:hypothetical protein